MKNICFFHPSSDLYGSDKILLNVLDTFKEKSEITVVLGNDGPLVEKISEIAGVKVEINTQLPILAKKFLTLSGILIFLGKLILFKKQCKVNKFQNYDVIYLNTIATVPLLMFCGKKTKKIVHLHETIDTNILFYKQIVRFVMKYADIVICVSNAVINPIKRVCGKDVVKLRRLYNGIEFANCNTDESAFKTNVEKVNFALIGRIKPTMKGQNMLVDSIALLPINEQQKATFHIIGSTVQGQEYMLKELKEYIRAKGVENCVVISSFVHDISKVYKKMDVILVPSLCEDSLPTTVLEAMHYSKPVIATISGGIPEMVNNGESGILIEKNNIVQFRDAIMELINNPQERIDMGRNAKTIFVNKFTKKIFSENYETLLKEIL